MELSLFQNYVSKQPITTILEAVVSMIRDDERIKSLTDAYRAAGEKSVKEASPLFGVAARFKGGKAQKDIVSLTGLSMVDIDHVVGNENDNDNENENPNENDNENLNPNGRMEALRARVCEDSHTLLCYRTISGEGLRVIFRYELDDSYELKQQMQFYPKAFAAGNAYYEKLLGVETDKQCKNVGRLSGLAHDPDVFVNPDAVAFTKAEVEEVCLRGHEQKRLKGRNSRALGICAKLRAELEQTEKFVEGNHHNFLVKLLFSMARHHISAKEARAYLDADFGDYHGEDYDQLIRSCYGSFDRGGDETTKVELIMDFLGSKSLRYDMLSRKIQTLVEVKKESVKSEKSDGLLWQELTERGMNDLFIECSQTLGKNFNYQDFRHVLNSGVVPEVNPLHEYILGLPEWDGEDYIGAVAAMVKIDNGKGTMDNEQLWHTCFKKWFCAMVASWMWDEVVNHQVLVLIGEQGIFKTTWLDALLPPELAQYRCRQTGARGLDKDEQLRATEFGLINMDEIDRMSEQELNALKSLITASDINVRAAYAQSKERRLRVASYVASGNKDRFLTDTTGNRRWLPFHVETIDSPFEHPLPYSGMYAQAWALVSQGFNYWFNITDIRSLNAHVDTFMVETNEEQLLPVYFAPCAPGTNGALFLTVAEISAKLTLYGNIRRPLDIRQLAALLRKLGYQPMREKSHGRRGFLVIELSADSVNAQRKLSAQ